MLCLKIDQIPVEEAGKGFALLDPEDMRTLGVNNWDLIEISGKKQTAARVMPLEESCCGQSAIQIDGITRTNAKVGTDDLVNVKKIQSNNAIKVVLAPIKDEILYTIDDSLFLVNRLNGYPLTAGDRVSIPLNGARSEEFHVLGTIPANAVVVRSTTKIELRKLPVGLSVSPNISYELIGGLKEQIMKIREMVELPLKSPQVFDRLGINPPRGVLLVGPPGSGKTLLARTVAAETNAYFQVINGPEVIQKFYGESEAKLRSLFDDAAKLQPSIIFLDELDAIAPKREKVSGDVEKRVVSQLLALMDGLKDRGKVIVIGATNLPSRLDPALRRPGRFDREITLDVPDREGRLEILRIHTAHMPLTDDVDLGRLADITHGFVGADIDNLCREAAMLSLRKALQNTSSEDGMLPPDEIASLTVAMDDFLEALREVEPSAVREIFVEIPKTTWDDIGGLTDVKQRLTEAAIWPLKHKNLFKDTGTKPPKGVLMFGSPGTGKTLLAKAVAHESGVNFISVKASELLSKYFGESEQAVREVFKKAKQVAPCILFFDEIDALAPSRKSSDNTNASERVVSQLLIEMAGIEELRGVLVLAATNRLDIVDTALLRAGRFDLTLEIPYPDQDALYKILKIHTANKPLARDVKLKEIAAKTKGLTGADIELLCQRASIFAIRKYLDRQKGAVKITHSNFTQAIDEFLSKETNLPSPLSYTYHLRTGKN